MAIQSTDLILCFKNKSSKYPNLLYSVELYKERTNQHVSLNTGSKEPFLTIAVMFPYELSLLCIWGTHDATSVLSNMTSWDPILEQFYTWSCSSVCFSTFFIICLQFTQHVKQFHDTNPLIHSTFMKIFSFRNYFLPSRQKIFLAPFVFQEWSINTSDLELSNAISQLQTKWISFTHFFFP